MQSSSYRIIVKTLIAAGLSVILVALALSTLFAAAPTLPIEGQTKPPHLAIPALPPSIGQQQGKELPALQSTGPLLVSKMLQTEKTNDNVVHNGETLTYTIYITNNDTTDVASSIVITDLLPFGVFNDIECQNITCTVITQTAIFTDPASQRPRTIAVPRQLIWTIPPLNPDKVITVSFTAKIACQADGAIVQNSVVVDYQFNGEAFQTSGYIQATVARQDRSATGAYLAGQATWCSDQTFGTSSMDWGDFDNDGLLDMALSSYDYSNGGVFVYHNEAGNLVPVWNNGGVQAPYIHWTDLDNNGHLELLAMGGYNYVGGQYQNYIYKNNLADRFTFSSNYPIYSWDLADFTGDGYLDLAAYDSCGLRIYTNTQIANAPFSLASSTCVDNSYPTTLAAADYNNDGYTDLAVADTYNDNMSGTKHVRVRILQNQGGSLSVSSVITPVDISVASGTSPYIPGLVAGDYDSDGCLDLAVAQRTYDFSNYFYTFTNTLRVYNLHPFSNDSCSFSSYSPQYRDIPISTAVNNASSPIHNYLQALDWADFDGDGRLELIVGDVPPKIYRYDAATNNFIPKIQLLEGAIEGYSYWNYCGYPSICNQTEYYMPQIRAIDYNGDGDLDLALANSDGHSMVFDLVGAFLSPDLTPIIFLNTSSWPAGSVAWGDANADDALDLLFGAGSAGVAGLNSKLFYNQAGTFDELHAVTTIGGNFNVRSVAFGNVNGDNRLEFALGSTSTQQIRLYQNSNTVTLAWSSAVTYANNSLAFGDVEADGDLDLLAGNTGKNVLFINNGTQLYTSPSWISDEADNTRSVAWAYVDGGVLPDFAAGNYGQANRVYTNTGRNTFKLMEAWNPPAQKTTSLAWGDYDGDGYMDLAVGNDGQPNHIYRNQGGTLISTPVWTATIADGIPVISKTTSLAWGDWNNDGKLDLAVGNYGEKVLVYENLTESSGALPQLILRWESAAPHQTTGMAWGDKDGDGDLDLAVSGNDGNGVFENNYIRPAHLLATNIARAMPLPNNPSYPAVPSPGNTAAAYFFPSAEILASSIHPTVTIGFKVFDPDRSRADSAGNPLFGDNVITPLRFEFSLNGGGKWQTATGSPNYNGQTLRKGQNGTFIWEAQTDNAISDDVRFRVTIANHLGPIGGGTPPYRTGLTQRGAVSAISPPFRVRATKCEWPENASITYPANPLSGVPLKFQGNATGGGNGQLGQMFFDWDFGNNITYTGQITYHVFPSIGTYVVTLTVRGVACPVTRADFVTSTINIGVGSLANAIYLPLILKGGEGSASTAIGPTFDDTPKNFSLPQVTGLVGNIQTGAVTLQWDSSAADNNILGYHLYHASMGSTVFQLLADLPADTTTYKDATASCGHMYFVTAYNDQGESLPSTASYFSPPCP